MRIVLGGSRQLSLLPDDVMENLNAWMREGAEFLLGEAKGTDIKFQEYFKYRKYENIKIYFSGEYARHNIGNWPTVKIESGLKSKSHAMHAVKDRKMTAVADSGLMVWDTLSAGTLSNILDLLDQGKPCQVYVAGDDSQLYYLNSIQDTLKWKDRHPDVFLEAEKRLKTYAKRINKPISGSDQTLF